VEVSREETMKVEPFHDHVLIERIGEETNKGNIIIHDTAKEKQQQGKVIAIGSGRLDEKNNKIPLGVKKGDIVLFTKYAGHEIKIAEKKYLIMREDDILCVVSGGIR
jgi:chaperonin GroES